MKWGLFDKIPRTQSISFKKLAQEGGIDEELASMLPVQGIEAQLSLRLQSRYIITVVLC